MTRDVYVIRRESDKGKGDERAEGDRPRHSPFFIDWHPKHNNLLLGMLMALKAKFELHLESLLQWKL